MEESAFIFIYSQHPQCEGVFELTNRFPFRIEASDGPYIPGEKVGGRIVIHAGRHAGAIPGAVFDIFSYPAYSPARQFLTQLIVEKANAAEAHLSSPQQEIPQKFCAKLAGLTPKSKLLVYSTDPSLWSNLAEQNGNLSLFTAPVPSEEDAHFVASVEDYNVSFYWAALAQMGDAPVEVGTPIPADDTKQLVSVLISAARFRNFASFSQTSRRAVDVNLAWLSLGRSRLSGSREPIMEVKTIIDSDDQGMFSLGLESGSKPAPLGVKLKNNAVYEDFYPHVFLFIPSTLEIGE